MRRATVAISHAGNNSVGESLAAGVPLLALPFSTDQFAIAADLERTGVARCLDPNALTATSVAAAVAALADGAERAAATRFVDAGAGAERAAERILDGPGASLAAGSSRSGTARGRRSADTPRPAADSSGGEGSAVAVLELD